MSLRAHIEAVFGRNAPAWRDAVEERLPSLVERWRLQLGDVIVGGWNSVVLGCRTPGGPAVLKLTLRADEVVLEGRALRHWGPRAAARVLACDGARGALLLERLAPATPMPPVADLAAAALGALHAAPPAAGFPTLAELYADAEERLASLWDRSPDAIARDDAALAATALRELAAVGGSVLLHGDPVSANFLLGTDGYRAVDPRPRIGDPAYDAAFWALFAEEGAGVAAKANALATRLELDHDRVLAWARAMAVDRLLQVADSPHHAPLAERLRGFIRDAA